MNNQETQNEGGAPIDTAVSGFVGYFPLKEVTLGVSDVRPLLILRKQLASDVVREVRVTWVDSNPEPSAINI